MLAVGASCGDATPNSGFGANAGSDSSAPETGGPGFGDAGTVSDGGKPGAPSLVPNGDFEQGNVLFGSDYAYATSNTLEGQYTAGANGQAFNGSLVSDGDHTSGHGLMFIGNGKATPDRVWFTIGVVSVQPSTQYYFEAWVMNLCCAKNLGDGVDPVGPSILSFYANDQLLGTRTSAKLGVWEGLSTTWNSGTASSVTLKLVNANTEAIGNDFAVDDIYLGTQTSIPVPK